MEAYVLAGCFVVFMIMCVAMFVRLAMMIESLGRDVNDLKRRVDRINDNIYSNFGTTQDMIADVEDKLYALSTPIEKQIQDTITKMYNDMVEKED